MAKHVQNYVKTFVKSVGGKVMEVAGGNADLVASDVAYKEVMGQQDKEPNQDLRATFDSFVWDVTKNYLKKNSNTY